MQSLAPTHESAGASETGGIGGIGGGSCFTRHPHAPLCTPEPLPAKVYSIGPREVRLARRVAATHAALQEGEVVPPAKIDAEASRTRCAAAGPSEDAAIQPPLRPARPSATPAPLEQRTGIAPPLPHGAAPASAAPSHAEQSAVCAHKFPPSPRKLLHALSPYDRPTAHLDPEHHRQLAEASTAAERAHRARLTAEAKGGEEGTCAPSSPRPPPSPRLLSLPPHRLDWQRGHMPVSPRAHPASYFPRGAGEELMAAGRSLRGLTPVGEEGACSRASVERIWLARQQMAARCGTATCQHGDAAHPVWPLLPYGTTAGYPPRRPQPPPARDMSLRRAAVARATTPRLDGHASVPHFCHAQTGRKGADSMLSLRQHEFRAAMLSNCRSPRMLPPIR